MGSFQSKLTGEVPVVGTPGSPSESQPLNNGEKPMAPFRDPRSISDDVERTPIQIAAEKRAKKNEASKENDMPDLNETPTAPSLPSRFKAASIDPRSPGGQGLPRTPIVLKAQDDNEKAPNPKEVTSDECQNETRKPLRGTAAFADKLAESVEIEELLESASKLEISDKEEEKKSADEQTSLEDNIAVTTDKKEEDNLTIPVEVSVTEESNSSEPDTKEDPATDMPSFGEDSSSPNNSRCGKKTMFPMLFAYEDAKSPRSPLGQISLNTKFMASPINSSASKGAGDCASDEQIDTQQVNSFRSKLRSASKLVEVINLVDDEEMEQNENTALTN